MVVMSLGHNYLNQLATIDRTLRRLVTRFKVPSIAIVHLSLEPNDIRIEVPKHDHHDSILQEISLYIDELQC